MLELWFGKMRQRPWTWTTNLCFRCILCNFCNSYL